MNTPNNHLTPQNSITILFERCLIPCAYYEQFWVRYIAWCVGVISFSHSQHIARGAEDCLTIIQRALESYLPKSIKLTMMKAEFMEEMGSVDEVKGFLNEIVEKKCPELLEAMVFYVEFLLRHDDRDGAEELLERFSTEGELWGIPRFRTYVM